MTLRLVAVFAVAVVFAACSKPEFRARLDAAPLKVGAPVLVAGVQVGAVAKVAVKGDAAEVTFIVEKEHQLTLHADACALAVPASEKGMLLVTVGSDGSLEKDAAIPQCRIVDTVAGALADDLKRNVNAVVKDVTRRLGGALGPSPCPSLRAKVAGVEAAESSPLFQPNGGLEVRLELENRSDTAVTVAPAEEAGFTDASGALGQVSHGPGAWSMPLELAAHARRAISVTLLSPAQRPVRLTLPVTYGFAGEAACTAELKLD